MPYFHGTAAALTPGDALLPGTLGGDDPDRADELWVWATTDLGDALHWARLRGWKGMWDEDSPPVQVYEVSLNEPVHEDANLRSPTTSVMASGGTVIRHVITCYSPADVEHAICTSREG